MHSIFHEKSYHDFSIKFFVASIFWRVHKFSINWLIIWDEFFFCFCLQYRSTTSSLFWEIDKSIRSVATFKTFRSHQTLKKNTFDSFFSPSIWDRFSNWKPQIGLMPSPTPRFGCRSESFWVCVQGMISLIQQGNRFFSHLMVTTTLFAYAWRQSELAFIILMKVWRLQGLKWLKGKKFRDESDFKKTCNVIAKMWEDPNERIFSRFWRKENFETVTSFLKCPVDWQFQDSIKNSKLKIFRLSRH